MFNLMHFIQNNYVHFCFYYTNVNLFLPLSLEWTERNMVTKNADGFLRTNIILIPSKRGISRDSLIMLYYDLLQKNG